MRCSSVFLLLFACGCGNWTTQPIKPPDTTPTPIKRPADATACLAEYGKGLAVVFRESADAFDSGGMSVSEVAEKMGDDQKAARVEAFLPLMEKLNDCEDAAAMAKVCRDFANQLEKK